ncbi:MAG: ABC transporter permease [Defluviicoccus sp.]|nr:ABC transporter permease [Defluviicoccus sp.]MDE0274280.1 ABC transporter permease [Defluviicoccus sp.]
MGRFFVQRLAVAVLVAITVSVIGFALLRVSGDLAADLAGEDASPAEIAEIAALYGLDRPLHEQYLSWAANALGGDLGQSLFTNEPVMDLILERVGVTILLSLYSLVLALAIAIPLGVLAAIRANTSIDRAALGVAVFGQAIPNFWFGLILIYLFGVLLRWLPISGSSSFAHFILPTVALGTAVMPALMRLTRTGMLEVLEADFIRTARAKGLRPGAVFFKHALRNAILPVVSLSAVSLGFLLGGSVIVETVFALNGIGLLAYESILRSDFPVVQSILVFVSLAYIVLTLASDLINARLDPRIRLG